MGYATDQLRKQFRQASELVGSLTGTHRSELESNLRSFLETRLGGREGSAEMWDEWIERSKRGLGTISELLIKELHREFDEVARRTRRELFDMIERVVCLIEDRYSTRNSERIRDDEGYQPRNRSTLKLGLPTDDGDADDKT